MSITKTKCWVLHLGCTKPKLQAWEGVAEEVHSRKGPGGAGSHPPEYGDSSKDEQMHHLGAWFRCGLGMVG